MVAVWGGGNGSSGGLVRMMAVEVVRMRVRGEG